MRTPRGGPAGDQAVGARLLSAGVAASAACLATGLGLWALALAPRASHALLTAGLVLLMASPAVRVALAVTEAVRARDRVYIASSIGVAVVLAATVALALAGR